MGMWLVLEGKLTLGMLIAFRIISGNVILCYNSQVCIKVSESLVSMERLSDILDQNPELSREEDKDQIVMPPIKGDIALKMYVSDSVLQVLTRLTTLFHQWGKICWYIGQSGSGKSIQTIARFAPDWGAFLLMIMTLVKFICLVCVVRLV